MTAIGINCSDREPVTIFNNPTKYRTPLEIEYRDAQHNAEHAWRNYTMMVDVWLANGDIEKMDAEEDACRLLDLKVGTLYRQLHCAHEDTHIEGRQEFIGGAYFDNTREICDLCEAKVRFHAHSLSEYVKDIP